MAVALRGLVTLALLMLSAHLAPARAQGGGRATRILILYSHDPRAPGVVGFTRELRGVLRREWPIHVELFEETLDIDRVGNRDSWPEFASYLAMKYRGVNFDAMVAEGSIALQFAVDELADEYPGIPLVYGAAFEPVIDFATLPAYVTGRRIPLPFAGTFALARQLQPDATRVVLVVGAGALDSLLGARAIQDITPLLDGMQLEVLQDWSYPSLLRSLRELPKEAVVILSSFRKDWRGQSFNTGDLIPSLTRASSVPVYGIARNWIGDGIVGGQTMQFAAEGGRTGELLVRVLREPRGTALPPQEIVDNPTVVDWRQLQRWGLSDARLPAGTEVLFRSPSIWERYGSVILLVLGVTTAQSTLIGLLLVERRRRLRAQQSVEAQSAYEHMLGALKLEVIQHVLDDAPRALEHAIAHIGRYAGAASAELVVHPERPDHPPEIVRWSPEGARAASSSSDAADATRLVELPLVSETTLVGSLTLRGISIDRRARSAEGRRLQAAVEVIAAALARARATRALAESRGHVAHLGRIATMDQLGAVVSHELRQPLTAIRFNAEAGALLLEQESADANELRALLRDIVNEVGEADDLIEHIRTLLRKQRGASVPVAINEICRNAGKLLQRAAQAKDVAVDYELADELPDIRGDAVQLQQVVLNLALNAIESAATTSGDRRVVLRTAARAGGVALEVHDSGPGLLPQVREHLFESYFSTKKSGLGMGLAIVHQIVEGHNGQVHAENDLAGGALFRVTLPVEPDDRRLVGAKVDQRDRGYHLQP